MPKTKFQDWIFTIMMVLAMVYCMTLYNLSLEQGFQYTNFQGAFWGMWYEVMAAFVAQKFIAGPLVNQIMSRSFKPDRDHPFLITLVRAGCNVMLMAPMMTLFVTILHHGFSSEAPLHWLPKLVLNFPFALCLQVFYIGPLVRWLFRTIFYNPLSFKKPQSAQAMQEI